MGQNRVDFADELEKRRTCFLFDEFHVYTDTQLWTKTLTGAGQTVTNPDGQSGVISLGNGGSAANSSAIVATTRKNWTFAASRPMYMECQLQYAEAATSGAGIFFGVSSGFGATFLADTTFVPSTNFSGCGIYKQAGDTVWRGITSVGTTQQLTGVTLESSQPSPTTTFQILRVMVDVVGTNLEVTYFVGQRETPGADGVYPAGLQQLRESTSGFNKPIKHRVAFASAAAMQFGVMEKQLNAGNAETVVVDYMGLYSLRT